MFELSEHALVSCHQQKNSASSLNVTDALRESLDNPYEFPALRRALTEDDQITIVVDERLPQLGTLITGLLEYLVDVGIRPEAITLLCAPPGTGQDWLDELPDALEEVRCEIHDPSDDKSLSFLNIMSQGRRLYLNTRMVDADQVIVLCGRRYDPFVGFGGGANAIYPTFSNVETQSETSQLPSLHLPEQSSWPLAEEAVEASWLLGAPFYIQAIEGQGDTIAGFVTGIVESMNEGQRLQNETWKRNVDTTVDTVVIGLSGDPKSHTFLDLADAVSMAVRVLGSHGRIILLTDAEPIQDANTSLVHQSEDPSAVLSKIGREQAFAYRAAWEWATAAEQAQIYLLSHWPSDFVEEMFAVPLDNPEQAQRLISTSESCLVLQDGQKTLAVLEP